MSDEKRKPDAGDDKDTEGHNFFATQDYYFQRNRDRQAEIEREARQRQQVKEARDAKKNRR